MITRHITPGSCLDMLTYLLGIPALGENGLAINKHCDRNVSQEINKKYQLQKTCQPHSAAEMYLLLNLVPTLQP